MSRPPVSVLKRQREQLRRERQQLKAEKRALRKNDKGTSDDPTDPIATTDDASSTTSPQS